MSKFIFCTDTDPCNDGGEHCPGPHDTVAYFTQIVLNGKCVIPGHKPESEKFVSKHHTIEISKAETVDSVEFEDGHKVKGKKVIIAGNFLLGIEYSAKCPSQTVHYFQCEIPFNAILLDCHCGKERLFPPDFCLNDYLVHVCLEHLQVHRVSERVFEKAIVLMIWLQPRDYEDC